MCVPCAPAHTLGREQHGRRESGAARSLGLGAGWQFMDTRVRGAPSLTFIRSWIALAHTFLGQFSFSTSKHVPLGNKNSLGIY